MQAIGELALLHIADKAIDPGDRLGQRRRPIQAKLGLEPQRFRFGANIGLQAVAPRRVEPVGIGKFVEQRLDPPEPRACTGRGQRRRDMADRDRTDASLGLRCLAGIVDDERVDAGHRPDQRLGPARMRQGNGFARQPFQRAVRADMHDRIGPSRAQPQIESDIAMARAAGEVVIVLIAIRIIPAFRLQRHQRAPGAYRRELEYPVHQCRIGFGFAPRCGQILSQSLGQRRQRAAILGQRPGQKVGGKHRS
ncbi:hypothetical protein D9M73_108700 [compost metagenome]